MNARAILTPEEAAVTVESLKAAIAHSVQMRTPFARLESWAGLIEFSKKREAVLKRALREIEGAQP